MTRSFRIYATKVDLRTILGKFQREIDVYFCPDYAKEMLEIDDIMPYFEVEPTELLQYDRFLVFQKGVPCTWRPWNQQYECKHHECMVINCHRLRGMEIGNLLLVEINTTFYEVESVKRCITSYTAYSGETVRSGCIAAWSAWMPTRVRKIGIFTGNGQMRFLLPVIITTLSRTVQKFRTAEVKAATD